MESGSSNCRGDGGGGAGDYTYLSLTTCKLANNAGTEIASNSLAGRILITEDAPFLIYLPIIFR